MWVSAVLPERDGLPGAEGGSSGLHGDRQGRERQRRANVRGHVIGSLVVVLELRVSITHQAGEDALEIGSYGRVGVFLRDRGSPTCDGGESEPAGGVGPASPS